MILKIQQHLNWNINLDFLVMKVKIIFQYCASIFFGISKNYIVSIILISSMTAPAYVAAADGKFYPGGMCKIAETDHRNRNNLRFGQFGFVVNQADKRVRVVCPIIRDDMDTNKGVTVRVFIHDSNPNDRLACQLMETSVWGDSASEITQRIATPDFIVGSRFEEVPRRGQNLRSLCNTGISSTFGSSQRIDCSLVLRTQNSAKWDRAKPGSGLHLICGLPARTLSGEFNGRSGIGGYFVEEAR